MRQSIVDRRSVGWCYIGRHSDLNVWVEVESVAVASGPSVPGLPAWELDSAKVTEKVAWAPASVSDFRFDAAPSSSRIPLSPLHTPAPLLTAASCNSRDRKTWLPPTGLALR